MPSSTDACAVAGCRSPGSHSLGASSAYPLTPVVAVCDAHYAEIMQPLSPIISDVDDAPAPPAEESLARIARALEDLG